MSWLSSTWAAVWPNLLASVIWAAPTFTLHHLLIRKHIDRRHRQLRNSLNQAGRAPQDAP